MTESWTGAGDLPEPAEDAQSHQCLPEGAAQPGAAAPRGTPEGHRGASVSSFSESCSMCFCPRSWKSPYRPPSGRDSRMSLAPPPARFRPLTLSFLPSQAPKGLHPRLTTPFLQSSLGLWDSKARTQVRDLRPSSDQDFLFSKDVGTCMSHCMCVDCYHMLWAELSPSPTSYLKEILMPSTLECDLNWR